MPKIACVAIVKNEASHIAEWLAWQFYAGFDTVVLYDNGSTDRTLAQAKTAATNRDLRVVHWPSNAVDFQVSAYAHAAAALAGAFAWVAFFDTDEFLVLADGLALKPLLAMRREAAIAVPRAMFGSSGHKTRPAGLVIEAYTQRAPAEFGPNRHVKSILRPERMRRPLSPHAFDMDGAYADLAGNAVNWKFPGFLADTPDYRIARLNHYFTRSWADWQAKIARGNPAVARPEREFFEYDRNEIFDAAAARQAPAIREMLGLPQINRHAFAIVACARWENRYIVEWLNYYRALGFGHVYLYCNDDDPTPLYERVLPFTQGGRPFVTFRYHPVQGEQLEMYAHFLRQDLDEVDWVGFFDIDEFLRLPRGETIAQLLERFDAGVECVLFNWVFFGTNGHKSAPEGNVLEHFTRREAKLHTLTKYVIRSRALGQARIQGGQPGPGFWHSPIHVMAENLNIVNVLGENMGDYHRWSEAEQKAFLNEPARAQRLFDLAIMHHYAFRSEAAFRERTARGLNGDFWGQTHWQNIAEHPDFEGYLRMWNEVEDTSLANFWRELTQAAWGMTTGRVPDARVPLSRRKPAMQSSVSEWSLRPSREEDAAGAVNGVVNGSRKFHTALEDAPWWQVDLGGFCTIEEIRIYNTNDIWAHRFKNFSLAVSIDGEAWAELHRKDDGEIVGHFMSTPFIWQGPGTAWGRYVRVTLAGPGYMHLDQVEVFGKGPAA